MNQLIITYKIQARSIFFSPDGSKNPQGERGIYSIIPKTMAFVKEKAPE